MPIRFNYTNRLKIRKEDIHIIVDDSSIQTGKLTFNASINLANYQFDLNPPLAQVYLEAYRGASSQLKRFSLGTVSCITNPDDCSLAEFGSIDGILFRLKITCMGDSNHAILVADADSIRPEIAGKDNSGVLPLIEHMASEDIGDEVWRIDFDSIIPILKINSKVPMGVSQFLTDPQFRALYAPSVMRQVLTKILIIDKDEGDENDQYDWRQRWLRFARSLPGVTTVEFNLNGDQSDTVEDIDSWINSSVMSFAKSSRLFEMFHDQLSRE